MKKILLVSLIFSQSALAQSTTPVNVTNPPATNPPATGAPATVTPGTGSVTANTPAAPPAEAPSSPWKLLYYAEVVGPLLGNLDLSKTQTPGGAQDYSGVDTFVKAGYAVGKNVVAGFQVAGNVPFDPTKSFSFYDLRLHASWNHMMETQDVDIQGVFKIDLPTTDKSRTAGKLFGIRLEQNWTLKTALRNWSFTAETQFKVNFFNDPRADNGKTDFTFAVYPYVTLDMWTNVQLLFEGSFDAIHNYTAASYDFQSGDFDFLDIGPLITINSHINTNIALRFYMEDISFKQAGLYWNIAASL